MGNRYGRNQKRAARERIAELEEGMRLGRALAEQQRASKDRIARTLDRVRDVLGDAFIGLEPRRERHRSAFVPQIQVRAYGPPPSARFDPAKVVDQVSYMVHVLEGAEFKVTLDRVRCMTHYLIRFKGESQGYFISDEALHSTPKSVLKAQIVDVLAEAFFNAYGGPRG